MREEGDSPSLDNTDKPSGEIILSEEQRKELRKQREQKKRLQEQEEEEIRNILKEEKLELLTDEQKVNGVTYLLQFSQLSRPRWMK